MGRTYYIYDDSGYYKDEVPAHPVDISVFRMGATPVTVGMWREYLRANTTLSMPEAPTWGWIDSHPMVNVSWDNIVGTDGKGGYRAWASRVSGVKLSLPTEAQFEFAARGGKDQKYPWGKEFVDSKVWSSEKRQRSSTAPVDRLNNVFINKFGVCDLSGNVWQWCMDGDQPYSKSFNRLGYARVSKDPVGIGQSKCVRGGSWFDDTPDVFRCANRYRRDQDAIDYILGFRLSAGSL